MPIVFSLAVPRTKYVFGMGIDMRFVIVTGMSGAGRSSVMRILEDDGYFCVEICRCPCCLPLYS